MNADITHADFTGRIVIVGFGSIGQGSLPLILRHIETRPENITIITGDARGRSVAESLGVRFIVEPLTRDNYRACLDPLLDSGDFLLNLSVDVSSIDLIRFCREKEALYLDTCIEPWPGGYTDPNLPISARTNYALREQALELRGDGEGAPTAVITHGANPGLVSHLVKQALLDIARDTNVTSPEPASRAQWADLAERLGVKVIHIAERDNQVANTPKAIGEFVNTWSIDGFVSEGLQPAELGWGTHENWWPDNAGKQQDGSDLAIFLGKPHFNKPGKEMPHKPIPILEDIPILGRMLFDHNLLIYFSLILIVLVVLKTAWDLLADAMRVLLDASLDPATLTTIRGVIDDDPMVTQLHWLTGRNAGRYRFVETGLSLRASSREQAEHALARLAQHFVRHARRHGLETECRNDIGERGVDFLRRR